LDRATTADALRRSDDEERDRLHRSLDRGLEDVTAGRTVEASEVIERLRSRAAARW
jgi:predicted transcriptional regulator